MRSLEVFAQEYHAEVLDRVQGGGESTAGITNPGDFKENVFTGLVLEDLEGAGVVEDPEVCFYSGRFGTGTVKVNGYAVSEEGDVVDLYTTVYQSGSVPSAISLEVVRTAAERAVRFVKGAFAGRHEEIEQSSAAYGMAERLFELRASLSKVRVIVLTNGRTGGKQLDPDSLGSLPVSFQIWDIERLHRSMDSGRPHEIIEIDLLRDCGTALPCLEVAHTATDYRAFLCVVPAAVLYALYEEYGARLLELNVRSFLQARGKVNKAIRETLKVDPVHFFPYNNGLSMTASEVRLGRDSAGHQRIEFIRGLQIVNGGQTTASIHRAQKQDRADLSQVYVQAKLTVVEGDRLDEMVPKISRYANSQNAVNEVDFSANHPYHIEIERLAASAWVPGEQSRWFYERARGQYQTAKAREGTTVVRTREFERRTPSQQKFTKTDLARYVNSWNQKPHLVSRGGQKNFVAFMEDIKRRGAFVPDVDHYKELIAQAIIYKAAQRLVNAEGFEAYRANVVTYSVALLSFSTNKALDLLEVWKAQALPPYVERTLSKWSNDVHREILRTAGTKNVTEWCKREECWEAVRGLRLTLPAELMHAVSRASSDTADGGQVVDREQLAQINACKRVSASRWMEVHVWATNEGRLSRVHRGVPLTMSSYAAAGWPKSPTPKQARIAMDVLGKAEQAGVGR